MPLSGRPWPSICEALGLIPRTTNETKNVHLVVFWALWMFNKCFIKF